MHPKVPPYSWYRFKSVLCARRVTCVRRGLSATNGKSTVFCRLLISRWLQVRLCGCILTALAAAPPRPCLLNSFWLAPFSVTNHAGFQAVAGARGAATSTARRLPPKAGTDRCWAAGWICQGILAALCMQCTCRVHSTVATVQGFSLHGLGWPLCSLPGGVWSMFCGPEHSALMPVWTQDVHVTTRGSAKVQSQYLHEASFLDAPVLVACISCMLPSHYVLHVLRE